MDGQYSSERFDIAYNEMPTVEETASEIKRRVAPSSGHLDGWIACVEPVFWRAHYVGKKTLPHLRQQCPGCAAGNLGECRVYVFVLMQYNGVIGAFDLPTGAIPELRRALQRHKSLMGLPISIGRKGGGDRGRVLVTVGDRINPTVSMMPAPSLVKWCERLWQEHLAQMVYATQGASAPTTPAEETRIANPPGRGRPRSKTSARDPAPKEVARPKTIAEALKSKQRPEIVAALELVSKVNGHAPNAS